MTTSRKTKAQQTLEDPIIQRVLQNGALADRMKDERVLGTLQTRFSGRKPRASRRYAVLRDPRDVAYRYLRRFRQGIWFRGGNHVARMDFGPGIGFPSFVNSRRDTVKAVLINCEQGRSV